MLPSSPIKCFSEKSDPWNKNESFSISLSTVLIILLANGAETAALGSHHRIPRQEAETERAQRKRKMVKIRLVKTVSNTMTLFCLNRCCAQ